MNRKSKLFAALVAAFAAQASMAATVDYHGYIRSGAGSSTDGGKEVCYRLPGNTFGVGYRLGNECDTYGELSFDAAMGEASGINFKLHTMVAFGTQQLNDWEQSTPSWRQAWVEANNIGSGALENATIWAGKRYYKRHDVHMLDFFYWNSSAPGAGIEGIDVGFGKLSYAYLRNGEMDWSNTAQGGYNPDVPNGGRKSITNHDFRIEGIGTNPGGSLELGVNMIRRNNLDGVSGKNGYALTASHNQGNLFGLGGFNNLVVQYARDAANLDGSGKWWADSNYTFRGWRVFNHTVFEPKGSNLNGSLFVGYEKSGEQPGQNGDSDKIWTIGARPVYHFTDAYSIAAEVGHTEVDPAGNGAKRKLTKMTIAPQLSMGKGFWARPAIRAYYTYAKWNDAAKAAGSVVCTGRDCGKAGSAFANETSGGTYGVQFETWW
ncbi:carbohydrate porin [Chitinimonas viridis]|uniref:Carbohydrate porin n=1 Tax=Chitinimonas viridis TaxID=664880 RepID=A0ABT8BA73_9NEIS|nr:carbohydrate porin [Chitinimonas viridis]MDN3578944.1 carbohydrate porin [Chitinimonas viridis]